MSLIYNAVFDKTTRKLSFEDKAGNEIYSFTVPERGSGSVDDITKPLTFKATQNGSTVKLTRVGSPTGSFQTSRDGGNTWADYTLNTVINLNTGDEVSFRAKTDRTSAQNKQSYFQFVMKGKIEAWHNVMSMYRTNDFATYDTVLGYSFYRVFDDCTSLIKVPALPATTLANNCYTSMFANCTSLTEVHELPATTLAQLCYYGMFWYCTSLTKAPVLSATTLADRCYYQMFNGCSSLNEMRCQMPSSYSSSDISSYASDWLTKVSSTGTFYTNADANWPSGASGIPTGWTRVNEGAPAVDDPKKPLMLRAIEDNSSVTLTMKGTLSNTYQTSTNGTDWTDYTLGTQISLNKEDVVYFRCSNHPTTQSSSKYAQFVMTGKVEAWHNAYSMIQSSFTNTGNSVGAYGMCRLFLNCKSLTKAPLLLNALEDHCYSQMFSGCASLTQAPSLPATALANSCYLYMFEGCTSLTQAPSLPATTLKKDCYSYMFSGCTSLTQTPSLPATTLEDYCYFYMFEGCTSLTQAPSLPATTLKKDCYSYMFRGCSKLKEVRITATTTAMDALNGWLSAVSATGDFYCDPNAKIFPTGTSGCPSGWTRRNINLLNALTLTATADNSSVKLTKNGTLDNTFEVDTGDGWTAYEFDTVIPLNAGQSCKWRCSAHPTTQSVSSYVNFVMTGTIEASGNCNSMLLGGFENLTSLAGYDYAFMSLFIYCTSLTKAPELPATALSPNCYRRMFFGCDYLVKSPELPATTLADYCYYNMFYGCSKLNEVRISATTSAQDALNTWLANVSATGDFYCDPNATIFPTGVSGCPSGWTRHALADYPATP